MMKAEQISEYIKTYPNLYEWLYFNVILNTPGNSALLTDSDNVLQEFIDGAKEREYIFSVAMSKNYDSSGTSNVNMEALKEVENFIAWIESNDELSIFPDFGEKCDISSMEVIDQVPQASIDAEKNIAYYTVSMKINYTERRQ